jgi:glycosyltransferase involved in cell wall biosynthesis
MRNPVRAESGAKLMKFGLLKDRRPYRMRHIDIENPRKRSSKLRILLVYYSAFSSFIKNDYELLSDHYEVSKFNIKTITDIFSLAAAVSKCDLTYIWFAGKHAFPAVFIAMAMGKRSIVVAGGYDVACEPRINYGQFALGRNSRMYARFALNNADIVLAVSEFVRGEALARSNPKRLEVVYNGIDVDTFNPGGKKEDLVLTVASGSMDVVKLKGIDIFVSAAAYLPEIKFEVIGLREKDIVSALPSGIPENVEFIGHMPNKELIKNYKRAKVYCQLSYVESFGVALAEAMACECVPVVSDRGALPEIVGDTGFYVPYGDVELAAKGIRLALESKLGSRARDRIKANFSKERRDGEIIRVIEELCGGDPFVLS